MLFSIVLFMSLFPHSFLCCFYMWIVARVIVRKLLGICIMHCNIISFHTFPTRTVNINHWQYGMDSFKQKVVMCQDSKFSLQMTALQEFCAATKQYCEKTSLPAGRLTAGPPGPPGKSPILSTVLIIMLCCIVLLRCSMFSIVHFCGRVN